MSENMNRRGALACLGLGAGTLFTLTAGVLEASPLAASKRTSGRALFVQISDSHIGFSKAANPDVAATLDETIDRINALAPAPVLVLHTGDVSHLSKESEFDAAQSHLARLKVSELHVIPGEHDVIGDNGAAFFARFGKPSEGRGYYSFDHEGVHFVGLVNVMHFQAGGLGSFGDDQLAWLEMDLRGRPSSQPLVIFSHMPMWSIYEPWGWGTSDADRVLSLVRRFGSVTILNGHIHQIVQKIEGHMVFHTARSTAYPQPAPGVGPGPGPLQVAPPDLPRRLGLTTVSVAPAPIGPRLTDTALA
jgi:hypothetical protein